MTAAKDKTITDSDKALCLFQLTCQMADMTVARDKTCTDSDRAACLFQLTRQMADMAAAKDKEIADRDQKLNRLKMQMADALKGNSW